jgi:hypothetical protein
MTVYQTPTSRIVDILRNIGIVVLFGLVLKSFLLDDMSPLLLVGSNNRQATVDLQKGQLRNSYTTTADIVITDSDDGLLEDIQVVDDDDDDLSGSTATTTTTTPNKSNDFSGPLSLHLIGERHSGTKWMSAHLQECFPNVHFTNNPFRWKHWFQDEAIQKYDQERFVIVAQFRNPYTWTEAMRSFPHHAPEHFHLDWPDFVTRSWTMPRYGKDLRYVGWTADMSAHEGSPVCAAGEFMPHQVIPCMEDRTAVSTRGIEMQALYELRNDGSGEAYHNILELRQNKINNFLEVANFARVEDLVIVQYEHAKRNGTTTLITQLEAALGQKAACHGVKGDANFRERTIPTEFRTYLQTHIDWDTEAKIGYYPSDSY